MNKLSQVLTKQEIADMPGEKKVHFLNDTAVRLNKSLGDAVGLEHIGFHIISIEPGKFSTEYHFHEFEEECTYVLSGTATITIDGQSQAVGPGDFIGYPLNGLAHTMHNTGHEPLQCIVVGQRLPQDVSEYPAKGKKLYRNNGAWELADSDNITRVK